MHKQMKRACNQMKKAHNDDCGTNLFCAKDSFSVPYKINIDVIIPVKLKYYYNLELPKEAVFIDSFKNCDDSYDCGKWDGHICCKILYLDKFLLEQSSTTGLCFVNNSKATVEKN